MYCMLYCGTFPKHTQNFLGACTQIPLHNPYIKGPIFCICPGPPQSSWQHYYLYHANIMHVPHLPTHVQCQPEICINEAKKQADLNKTV